MNIVFLASAINVHTIRWVNKLVEMGNSVSVISCRDHVHLGTEKTEMVDKVDVYTLPFSSLSGVGYFLNARACRKIVNKLAPDVVNAHYASGYGTLARVARLEPVALSVWGSDVYLFPDRSKWHRLLLVSNLKYADLVMSTSEIMAERVKTLMDDDTLQIPITPFGVDIEKFSVKKLEQSERKQISIGIIKSLKRIYGIENLIEAVGIIRDTGDQTVSNLIVNIFGDGPHRQSLEEQVKSLGLESYFRFHGVIPNKKVPEVLSEIDIYVLPSLHESFGVAAVEAMASGIPVIASDAPGLLEVVTDNVNGIRFHAGESGELAEAITRLMLDAELRQQLGAAGRAEVERRFIFDQNAKTLVESLESLVAK